MIFYNSVSKIYSVHRNPVPVLNNVTFRIPHGEVVVFLGPSGCGKSTMLRMTNRIESVTQGHILVNDQDIQTINPITLRLKMGYVIQEVGLFPNKTVSQNIAIAPRLLKWKTRKINHRVDELLELVNLDPRLYRDRYPIQLSGGQQQRVGIARALAADPEILLMDEPFGAIDPINRDQIQDEFLKLQSKLKKTVIFVSHDIHEAIKMADKIAIFNKGQLVQYDTPENILTQPANDFVADFIGADAALKILSLLRAKDIVKRNEKLLLSGTTQAKDALAHIEMHQLRYAIVLVDNKLHGFVNPKILKYESGQISNLAKKFKVVVDGRDTLRDVLSELLANDSTVACVTDQDNNFLGTVTYNNIHANIVDKFEGDDAD